MSDKSPPDPIIVQHLSKSYDGKWVVKDLNFKVPAGCVYGFLGRNGAGKSTTIKMLTGMVCPDNGSVSLLGEDVATMTPETRARIAYMAEGHPLYSWMTIGQIVKFVRPFYKNWDQFLVDQVLDHFELSRQQKCGRLSKGQQAQVSLALAMAPAFDRFIDFLSAKLRISRPKAFGVYIAILGITTSTLVFGGIFLACGPAAYAR